MKRVTLVAALAAVVVLLGCSRSSPVATESAPTIEVLSNRADLISGGDALIRINLPSNATIQGLKVALNGKDVSSVFVQSSTGAAIGLVDGLTDGRNILTAKTGSGSDSVILINHPNGGPVFSGPQLQPWTCLNSSPTTDSQCNQPAQYTWQYKSTSGSFQTYDPSNPPSNVATTTTDQGVTVPYIVRIETGYQDRDQYQISVLYQPSKPWTAAQPQAQFNHKLVVTHGGSCGVDYQNATAPVTTSSQSGDQLDYALGSGFAVMSTSLNNSGHNCNVAVQAESEMMAKEHLIESYGTLRYTIGTGCSGGSLAQHQIENAYPGIYQGLLVTCSFPDAWTTATQFLDYHVLLNYFGINAAGIVNLVKDPSTTDPSVLATTVSSLLSGTLANGWNPIQIGEVLGGGSDGAGIVNGIVNASVSEIAQFHVIFPTDACLGITDAQRYSASNPSGIRCDIQDAQINLLAPNLPADWSKAESQVGHGFAGLPVDNVGVQYGLASLKSGTISVSQFLDLNARAGGIDGDINSTTQRRAAPRLALENVYRSGGINETNNLDTAAIIDCRGPNPGLFHDAYRAFAVRARLDREHGGHGNQVIWEGPYILQADLSCALNSLKAMDQWLAAVEQDSSKATLAQKILSNKPSTVTDECWDGVGNMLSHDLCGSTVVQVYGTPRMVAGDSISTDINKCQLKPLDPNDYFGTPGPIGSPSFTAAQWAQMQQIFPNGVCDFSKPGVGQQPTIPWQTYQDSDAKVIYGGKALPVAPPHSGSGWASPAFQIFAN